MGYALAERGYSTVFGGGGTGLMGALADAALERGGEVTGIVPVNFNTPALVHPALTELIVVKTMHERKAMMIERADAFIALPGGFGTFEELFEILTWAQIGLHGKAVGVLNVEGYFEPLFSLIEHAGQEGFLYREHTQLLLRGTEPGALLDEISRYAPPSGLEKWVNREEQA
jgi:uncharacterized protein (TIGR00730 family)